MRVQLAFWAALIALFYSEVISNSTCLLVSEFNPYCIYFRDRLLSSSINQGIVHSVINSLVAVDEHSKPKAQLALYKSVFESRFLETTSDYYKQKASEYISELSVCEYLEKVCSLVILFITMEAPLWADEMVWQKNSMICWLFFFAFWEKLVMASELSLLSQME